MHSDILPRIRRVAVETFGCPPEAITEATTAADVAQWDSLRHLIFISGVEQEFGVEFEMDAIAKMTRVADLVALIEASPT